MVGYTNREPRFYASVAFNGAQWNALSIKEEREERLTKQTNPGDYRGATDGRINGSDNWCITGIGIEICKSNDCAKWEALSPKKWNLHFVMPTYY